MKTLYIVGAGGFGREVAWLVERINQVKPTWNLAGFIDDDAQKQCEEVGGYPVIGTCDYFARMQKECWTTCAIGAPKIRKQVVEQLRQYQNIKFATLIDPSALLSERVQLSEGCIICANSILTVDIRLSQHSIINLNCTVGHDVSFGDYLTAYPSVNISGNVYGGECIEIGTGVQIRQGIRIQSNAVIGAGAVIVSNITEPRIYVGVPARVIK